MPASQQNENTTTLPKDKPAQGIAVSQPTVLVFDSGVGGLSVYQEIRRLLPDFHYIFAFDNLGFPYGEKEASFIIERAVTIIEEIQQQHLVSIAIIACNTASALAREELEATQGNQQHQQQAAAEQDQGLTAQGIFDGHADASILENRDVPV